MIADAAAVGVMGKNIDGAVMADEAIENVDRLARRAGDDFHMKGGVAIRDMGVELDDRIAPVVSVDLSARPAFAVEIEMLSIG